MKVAIIGGGIGGMSLALSLVAVGVDDIDIYESAPGVRELGVGINVLPHAIRELTELGLLDQLSAVGIPTADFTYFSRLGQRIWEEPLGLAAGYRWPQFSIHRGELLGVLHRAVVDRLGAHRVHTGHHLARFEQPPGHGVSADFVERETSAPVCRVEADLLVGCDGIHSVVRRALCPAEGPPKWNGVVMWRGATIGKPFLSGRSMVNIGSSRQRAVVYPISRADEEKGQALINWVATVKLAATPGMPPQDWTHVVRREEVLAAFASFSFDFLDVAALIRDAELIYQYPMVDRDPLRSWNSGRVTLLGDAAHPMHPVGGNGASQAILDARVLARELALQRSMAAAVAAYDNERRPATAALVQSNRRAGPHRCQDLVDERAPSGFTELSDVVSQQELQEIADDYKQIAGFEMEELNNRPSRSVGLATP
ncbi:MAG: flavin-dependent oxidoreductase [Candidatus Dormibacteraeota bacterium]|nr:flavin-dependent oxidoreductase [Candidatus Dormibacteraeota bacterium]